VSAVGGPATKTASHARPEICPRCEDGLLASVETTHDVMVEGSLVRIPEVRVDECPVCGYRSLSGREVHLIEVLFRSRYDRIADLVADLRAAGYHGMFLRQDQTETGLDGLQGASGLVPVDVAGRLYRVKLPKIGEGENGTVFDYDQNPTSVFKVAKPRPYCRDHVLGEAEQTGFFEAHGVPVPRILEVDRFGRFVIKERLAGQSLAVVYDLLGDPLAPRHVRVRGAVQRFVERLLDLFAQYPSSKISVSPNNIFVVESRDACECLLVDTGLAPFHDYSAFDFREYWDVTVPQKIRRYREVGYIEADHAAPAGV
jgi:YgiT-type zinc finger domain-containing protein